MANAAVINKKVVLKFKKGSYSFDKINLLANDDQLYGLATILNSFQAEVPTKYVKVITSQII